MAKADASWSEVRVFRCLASVFAAPAWVLLPQVRNGTGYSRRVRTADALAASVWPSRGLYFAGVEIKVSKSDWSRELANAEKSAEIQQYCLRWYIAAPQGVVPEAELPPTWGLIECKGDKAAIVKAAPDLQPVAPDIAFVCAVLRGVQDCTVPAEQVSDRIQEAVNAARSGWASDRNYQHEALKASVAAFEAASGVTIGVSWEAGNIGQAVKMVRECGASRVVDRLRDFRDAARKIADHTDKVLMEAAAREAGAA